MKTRILSFVVATAAAVSFVATSALADVRPHSLFSGHMVLQQGQTVPVWGEADPGEKVEVAFASQKVQTTADKDGRWKVLLEPLAASSQPAILRVNDIEIPDVLVGEVWVCSGQSNMAMAVSRSSDAESAAAAAEAGEYPLVRLFRVPGGDAGEPQTGVNASWETCSAQSVTAFSATGFFFGSALQQALGVPVGLIQSAVGGTNAYSWISNDALKSHPGAEILRGWFQEQVDSLPEATKQYEAALERHARKVADAKAAGTPLTGTSARKPLPPMGPDNPKRPTCLYNAMIAPLQPFAMKGVIWYQGEANSRDPWAPDYQQLMTALVDSWRADWDQPENKSFPFYIVQLPNYANGDAWGWPVIRESMLNFWQEGENTGMVVTLDVGDPGDIHPKNKAPVGERLALFARGNVYGEDVVFSGPVYRDMKVSGGEVALRFDHTGSGLASTDGEPLKYFAIAGKDMEFVDAEATIAGDRVVVRSAAVASPVAVRYAWLNNPEGANFANKEGLLASPFRTDTGEIPPPAPATP